MILALDLKNTVGSINYDCIQCIRFSDSYAHCRGPPVFLGLVKTRMVGFMPFAMPSYVK